MTHPMGGEQAAGTDAADLGVAHPLSSPHRPQIGAGSVVLIEVPAGATVVGIPGRIVVPKVSSAWCRRMRTPF